VIVICAEDRIEGAKEAIRLGANIILLDDGYQHLRLQRDCNILLVGKSSNGNVIPFGKNREPINAAADADVILWMDDSSFHLPHKKDALISRATVLAKKLVLLSGETIAFSAIKDKRILAVSSIAQPQRFHSLLQTLGAEVVAHALADHAEYSNEIIRSIYSHAKDAKCDFIVTTTKDIVKAENFYSDITPPCSVAVLHIEYEIEDRKEFFDRIKVII
jgi:tetraacyldisaccharide 4'-kinase